MVKRFLTSGRSGFYLSVTQPGEVAVGDEIKLVSRDPHGISIAEFNRIFTAKSLTPDDLALIQKMIKIPALPQDWKDYYREGLARIG